MGTSQTMATDAVATTAQQSPDKRTSSRRPGGIASLAALLLLLIAGSAPISAYKLILKDGQEIDISEPYRVVGERAVFRLTSGTESSIALSEVDLEKTRAANERDLGTAVVINRDGTSGSYDPEENSRQQTQTLQRLLRERRQQKTQDGPTEDSVDLPAVLRKTAAGNDDLLSLEREQALDPEIRRQLDSALRKQGVGSFSIYQGSKVDRLFLEWPIRSEEDLMDSLPRGARAISETIAATSLTAVELLFVTSSRQRAGQFLIDEGNAPTLIDGIVSAPEFYIAFVQF